MHAAETMLALRHPSSLAVHVARVRSGSFDPRASEASLLNASGPCARQAHARSALRYSADRCEQRAACIRDFWLEGTCATVYAAKQCERMSGA